METITRSSGKKSCFKLVLRAIMNITIKYKHCSLMTHRTEKSKLDTVFTERCEQNVEMCSSKNTEHV